MSKGIIEIDIPKNCDECPIRQSNLAYCLIAKKSTSHHPSGKALDQSKRPNWCPIKPQTDNWIPTSERLPGPFEVVQITAQEEGDREPFVYEGAIGAGDMWEVADVGRPMKQEDVKAWMPLPEPYKDGDRND